MTRFEPGSCVVGSNKDMAKVCALMEWLGSANRDWIITDKTQQIRWKLTKQKTGNNQTFKKLLNIKISLFFRLFYPLQLFH